MSVAGFTLVELLTVIAIISILAGILIVTVGPIREKSRLATCTSNLHQIGIGMFLEIADTGYVPDRLETVNSSRFPHSIANYLYTTGRNANDLLFFCPSADDTKTSSLGANLGATVGYNNLCYARNNALGAGYKAAAIAHPAIRMMAIEANSWNFSQLNIADRYAPRHRSTPKASNPLGEAGNILFLDGHVELRAMSMNPPDMTEWNNLGNSSNMTQ